ncbi:hypothetical protein PR202_ga24990 [Eleusine coracana subsp. coracana]|uniref:Uncharacterized protein n=1 Tax=Eleusine coracana subsp. coracana TaxID=191504 RepID=A0AAV5D876_ELECO|nr:hypothetical protein PR202_ga24990 [Eleusine coracana subsp. coracana]
MRHSEPPPPRALDSLARELSSIWNRRPPQNNETMLGAANCFDRCCDHHTDIVEDACGRIRLDLANHNQAFLVGGDALSLLGPAVIRRVLVRADGEKARSGCCSSSPPGPCAVAAATTPRPRGWSVRRVRVGAGG